MKHLTCLKILTLIVAAIKFTNQRNTEQTYEYRMNSGERKVTRKSGGEILVEPANGQVKSSIVWMHGLGDTAEVSPLKISWLNEFIGLDQFLRRE